MSCENHPRFLFTPYPIPSNLGAILPLFDFSSSSARLAIQEFRFTGLASTFSLLVSFACLPIPKPKRGSIADRQDIPLL